MESLLVYVLNIRVPDVLLVTNVQNVAIEGGRWNTACRTVLRRNVDWTLALHVCYHVDLAHVVIRVCQSCRLRNGGER